MMSDVMKLISYICGTSKNQPTPRYSRNLLAWNLFESIGNPLSYKELELQELPLRTFHYHPFRTAPFLPTPVLQTCQASASWVLCERWPPENMCWISQAIPNDQLIYHKQWSRLCTLLLHHLRHISCKTVKKACLPMHSCKFSRKKSVASEPLKKLYIFALAKNEK